jgi:hypothetical protein
MPTDFFITSARTEVPTDRIQSLLASDFNLCISDSFSSGGIFGLASTESANLFKTSLGLSGLNVSSGYRPDRAMKFPMDI